MVLITLVFVLKPFTGCTLKDNRGLKDVKRKDSTKMILLVSLGFTEVLLQWFIVLIFVNGVRRFIGSSIRL